MGRDLSITLEGLAGTEFSFSGNSSVTVKANKTYNLNLTYKPGAAGPDAAVLKIKSNDPDTPTFEIALSGTGQ